MTDGSSQGLFVVVAVVIFGIFVAISYSLFRDNLTPSLAGIFSESIVMPTTFYLADTPKGVEYIGTEDYPEFVKIPDMDLSKLGDAYTEDTIFEITFYIKTNKDGKFYFYTQNENGNSRKYALLLERNNFIETYDYTFPIENKDAFVKYTERFILKEVNYNIHFDKSNLSFYAFKYSGSKITVKDISIRRVGTLK